MKTYYMLLMAAILPLFTAAQSSTEEANPVLAKANLSSISFHYWNAHPQVKSATTGFGPGNGFDVAFLHKGVALCPYTRLFLGANMGFAWHQRSLPMPVDVVVDTKQVKGNTFLRNQTLSFDFVGKLQWGNSKIRPYAMLLAGPRWMSTHGAIQYDQHTATTESTNSLIAQHAMLEYGGGVGLTYFFHPRVALDIMSTYMDAFGSSNYVDISKAVYNPSTTHFDITSHSNQFNPSYLNFKIGLLIQLDADWFWPDRSIYLGSFNKTSYQSSEAVIVPAK